MHWIDCLLIQSTCVVRALYGLLRSDKLPCDALGAYSPPGSLLSRPKVYGTLDLLCYLSLLGRACQPLWLVEHYDSSDVDLFPHHSIFCSQVRN